MKTSITVTDHDDNEYIVEANVSAVVPAKLSGPPEDCYPAEGGEVEDHEVWEVNAKGDKGNSLDYDEFLKRPGIKSDDIDERLYEAAADCDCDDDYDDRDDCRDDVYFD